MEKNFCVEFVVDSRWLAGVEATMAYAWASWTQGKCLYKVFDRSKLHASVDKYVKKTNLDRQKLCIIEFKKFKKIVVQINENLSWVCIDLTKRSF